MKPKRKCLILNGPKNKEVYIKAKIGGHFDYAQCPYHRPHDSLGDKTMGQMMDETKEKVSDFEWPEK